MTAPDPTPDRGPALVVHGGALGDVVLSIGLLRQLAVDGDVWLVAPWSIAQCVARLVPGVAAVDGDQPRWARLYAPSLPSVDDDLAAALGAARAVLSFVARSDDPWSAHLARLAPRAARACVSPRPPDGWTGHVTAWQARALADQGIAVVPWADAVPLPSPRAIDAAAPVVLHPGSGALAKCWPPERFAALAESLQADGRTVVIVLGDAERERWRESDLRRWRSAFDVRLPPSPTALAALLETAAGFVGNDSGPTHLAAALGVPTVALFGPTPPSRWRPIGAAVTVVAPRALQPMAWLDVAAAAAAVRGALGTAAGSGVAPDAPR